MTTTAGLTMTSSLAISLLPEKNDRKTGGQAHRFFQTTYTDIGVHSSSETGAFLSEVDKEYHLIHRWRLEKSDDCTRPIVALFVNL